MSNAAPKPTTETVKSILFDAEEYEFEHRHTETPADVERRNQISSEEKKRPMGEAIKHTLFKLAHDVDQIRCRADGRRYWVSCVANPPTKSGALKPMVSNQVLDVTIEAKGAKRATVREWLSNHLGQRTGVVEGTALEIPSCIEEEALNDPVEKKRRTAKADADTAPVTTEETENDELATAAGRLALVGKTLTASVSPTQPGKAPVYDTDVLLAAFDGLKAMTPMRMDQYAGTMGIALAGSHPRANDIRGKVLESGVENGWPLDTNKLPKEERATWNGITGSSANKIDGPATYTSRMTMAIATRAAEFAAKQVYDTHRAALAACRADLQEAKLQHGVAVSDLMTKSETVNDLMFQLNAAREKERDAHAVILERDATITELKKNATELADEVKTLTKELDEKKKKKEDKHTNGDAEPAKPRKKKVTKDDGETPAEPVTPLGGDADDEARPAPSTKTSKIKAPAKPRTPSKAADKKKRGHDDNEEADDAAHADKQQAVAPPSPTIPSSESAVDFSDL